MYAYIVQSLREELQEVSTNDRAIVVFPRYRSTRQSRFTAGRIRRLRELLHQRCKYLLAVYARCFIE